MGWKGWVRGRVGAFHVFKICPASNTYTYINLYMYIYVTYKASRLVDQHLDADRRIRNEELEWNINI